MRVIDILRRRESGIIDEAVRFAQSLSPLTDEPLDSTVLRDHLPAVLRAMVRDLEQPQTRTQEITKSEGRAPPTVVATAAQVHGRMRAESGLSVDQVVAEFRVLRSVISRMWNDSTEHEADARSDMIRFNEAIDQAIAESVAFHSAELRRWRNTLLAVIGHDLRNPLQGLVSIADFLASRLHDTEYAPHLDSLVVAAERLGTLLNSLMDYSTTQFGRPMPLTVAPTDLAAAIEAELELMRSAHPEVPLLLRLEGDLNGVLDESRVREALSNLLANAIQYSEPGTPVRVTATDMGEQIRLEVHNRGAPIPEDAVHRIFEPLRRTEDKQRTPAGRNLGIGLFIVREIARAHGGTVGVDSADGNVVFWMEFCKRAATEP
jgi:signal transduction histidine kinase